MGRLYFDTIVRKKKDRLAREAKLKASKLGWIQKPKLEPFNEIKEETKENKIKKVKKVSKLDHCASRIEVLASERCNLECAIRENFDKQIKVLTKTSDVWRNFWIKHLKFEEKDNKDILTLRISMELRGDCRESDPITIGDESVEPGMTLMLNTAMQVSPFLRFAVRMHGQVEIHGFIAGKNRKWFAKIIQDFLDQGLLRKTEDFEHEGADYQSEVGWEALIDMLLSDDKEAVVMSTSNYNSFERPETITDWSSSEYEQPIEDKENPWPILVPRKSFYKVEHKLDKLSISKILSSPIITPELTAILFPHQHLDVMFYSADIEELIDPEQKISSTLLEKLKRIVDSKMAIFWIDIVMPKIKPKTYYDTFRESRKYGFLTWWKGSWNFHSQSEIGDDQESFLTKTDRIFSALKLYDSKTFGWTSYGQVGYWHYESFLDSKPGPAVSSMYFALAFGFYASRKMLSGFNSLWLLTHQVENFLRSKAYDFQMAIQDFMMNEQDDKSLDSSAFDIFHQAVQKQVERSIRENHNEAKEEAFDSWSAGKKWNRCLKSLDPLMEWKPENWNDYYFRDGITVDVIFELIKEENASKKTKVKTKGEKRKSIEDVGVEPDAKRQKVE